MNMIRGMVYERVFDYIWYDYCHFLCSYVDDCGREFTDLDSYCRRKLLVAITATYFYAATADTLND